MKLKGSIDKTNNSKQKDLNFEDIFKLDYQTHENKYNFINQNNFYYKKYSSRIHINKINYLISIKFTQKNKTLNFLKEIKPLIIKKFILFLLNNY